MSKKRKNGGPYETAMGFPADPGYVYTVGIHGVFRILLLVFITLFILGTCSTTSGIS